MKKIVIALVIIAVVGTAAYFAFFSKKPETLAAVATGPVTVEAKNGTISVVVEGAAVVEAYQQITLRTSGSAVLLTVKKSGQQVAKDGIVATLDDSVSRNNLSQAELNLSQAELDVSKSKLALQRSRKDAADTKILVENKAASQDKLLLAEEALRNAEIALETAEIKVQMAKLALDKAKREVQDAVVRAPFAGTVLKSFAEEGDLLSGNSPIALFGDVSRLRLSAEVDEFDIGKITIGRPVTISGDAVGEESIRSVVESISPIAEIVNNISIFTVSAVIGNEEGKLRPGMSADFSILISSDKGLVVPSKSVSSVRGRSYLEVMENGEVVKKRVETGADDGINLVVLSGIEEGAQVVVPGAIPVAAPATPAPAAGSTTEKSVLPITIPGSGGTK